MTPEELQEIRERIEVSRERLYRGMEYAPAAEAILLLWTEDAPALFAEVERLTVERDGLGDKLAFIARLNEGLSDKIKEMRQQTPEVERQQAENAAMRTDLWDALSILAELVAVSQLPDDSAIMQRFKQLNEKDKARRIAYYSEGDGT